MATVTKPILLDETGQAILSKLNEVSILPQIVDNCTTADANKALSANQGKQLLDTINGMTNYIARGNVSSGNLDNLTSCGTYNCDNCTNLPCTYAKVVVESDAAGSWIKQTATNILSPYRVWYRIKNGSEPWTSWILQTSTRVVASITSWYNSSDFYAFDYAHYTIIGNIAQVCIDFVPRSTYSGYKYLFASGRHLPFCPAGAANFYTRIAGGNCPIMYFDPNGLVEVNDLTAGYHYFAAVTYPIDML